MKRITLNNVRITVEVGPRCSTTEDITGEFVDAESYDALKAERIEVSNIIGGTYAIGALPVYLRSVVDEYHQREEAAGALAAIAKLSLDSLTGEQRLELFVLYCRSCGGTDSNCQCGNDE